MNFTLLSEFRPTTLDRCKKPPEGMETWVVSSIAQHRDSDPLQKSNFWIAIDKLLELEGELHPQKSWEILRYNHWASGWFEIIGFDPKNQLIMDKIVEMQESIEEYPILDEDHYSKLQWEHEDGMQWDEDSEDSEGENGL